MGSCSHVLGWHMRFMCSSFRVFSNLSIVGLHCWPWTSSLASLGYAQSSLQSTGTCNVFCGSSMATWFPCLGVGRPPGIAPMARQLPLRWRWSPPNVFATTLHVACCVVLRRGWACYHRRRVLVLQLQPRLQTLLAHQQSNMHCMTLHEFKDVFAAPGKPPQPRVKHCIVLVDPTKPPSKHCCY